MCNAQKLSGMLVVPAFGPLVMISWRTELVPFVLVRAYVHAHRDSGDEKSSGTPH